MEWKITFASDVGKGKKMYTTHINTLEELKELSQKYNEALIVNFVNNEIIIYDADIE